MRLVIVQEHQNRLPAIDEDLAALQSARFDPGAEPRDRIEQAIAHATGRPSRPSFACAHTPPRAFQPGKTVPVVLEIASSAPPEVTLRYRRVNHAERWQSLEMARKGRSFQAAIPGVYTESPYALEYYFELRQGPTAGLYPGFNEAFANQPYFVIDRG